MSRGDRFPDSSMMNQGTCPRDSCIHVLFNRKFITQEAQSPFIHISAQVIMPRF